MKAIIKYQTTDGREFDSEEKAKAYAIDVLHGAIYTVVCNAAQRGDCKGFIGNHAEQFTESIIQDLPFLREKIAFFDANQNPENDD